MKRRNFMMAIAGAMTVPLINLRNTVPAEKLMQAFCNPDYHRFDLSNPFGAGSLTYATDSWAMVRAELVNRDEYATGRLPDVRKVWSEYWNPTGSWVPLVESGMMIPTIEMKDYNVCPECGMRRVSLGDYYPDPDDPRIMLDYDPDDNSIRDVSCVLCRGRDYNGKSVSCVLGVRHVSFGLRRIAVLPNAMVCRSASNDSAVLFRADGFEGISLGIVPDAVSK